LLAAITETPDPDFTLVNLSKVSDSLGGKGVLWELFSFNAPSLKLYVQLCASSPYLCGILTSSPGMIDELMDSLMLDKLPSFASLQSLLEELCRGAEDIEPMLHSFKKSQHLRVGVRDILGKEDIRATHAALSDTAEACLHRISSREYDRLTLKFGVPLIAKGQRAGEPCGFTILAMGKLGGREPNYHSDLDIVFLYEDVGFTQSLDARRGSFSTSNQHFFSQLGQRIIKVVTHLGPYGRLYDLDPRLRPTGKSGSLAVPLPELARYFQSGQGQLWERQALCKARPVYGSPAMRKRTKDLVHSLVTDPPWRPENAESIRSMRFRLQGTASRKNLKRGPGGTVDIEFTVQMLQLKYARQFPRVLQPGTLAAIEALREAGALNEDDAEYFSCSYRFLRSIEARLRLMNTTARHDIPEDEEELRKLAYLLGADGPDALARQCASYVGENRRRFNRLFDEAAAG
jgi:glutamate-ammonia-ligase adenylyltransferase